MVIISLQMVELSSASSSTVNIYQPHRVLMASCKLRLAHTLTLMASSATANDRGNLITSAMAACEDGLQLLKDSAYTNPPLEAELKFHRGKNLILSHRIYFYFSSILLFRHSVWLAV